MRPAAQRQELFWCSAVPIRAFLLMFVLVAFGRAQQPNRPAPPPPEPEPPQTAPESPLQSGYTIQRSVDLVVLHISVTDEHGQFVPGLKAENFRVFEDNSEQKISILRSEERRVGKECRSRWSPYQ